MSAVLLPAYVVGGQRVELLGDDYTGALILRVNGQQHAMSRDELRLLVERMGTFLAATEACPRCGHGRPDHFVLWTTSGKLRGCSHGMGAEAKLVDGLLCDCSGAPGDW